MKQVQQISLRAMEPEDLDLLYRIENDESMWGMSLTNVPYSRFVLHEFMSDTTGDIYTDKQVRLIVEDDRHQPIGLADIMKFDPKNQKAEIGIIICKSCRCQGYAKAAVEHLHQYAHDTQEKLTAMQCLPDSLLGNYARMIGGESYDISSREIGPLAGSDSEMTERYDTAFARTLGDVLDTVRGTVSAGRANAFIQAQRQWQMALDGKVNAVYKAASREDRKLIAGWRIMLDQVYAARTEMLDMLYGAAPEVGEEVLMNLYKNAALDAAER